MIEIKIPKEVKVGGIDYEVKIDSQTDRELADCSLNGSSSELLRRIEVSSTLNAQCLSETFIHEFCHAVNNIYCDSHILEPDIDGISHGIHQILEELGVRFVK